jgi:hypothetical protein
MWGDEAAQLTVPHIPVALLQYDCHLNGDMAHALQDKAARSNPDALREILSAASDVVALINTTHLAAQLATRYTEETAGGVGGRREAGRG